MSDAGDAKIHRWRGQIAECQAEARSQTPEGRKALQSIIDSYERLIGLVQRRADKPKA